MILNESHFRQMACADLAGFVELTGEFFVDARERAANWLEIHERGAGTQLREEFHRCKGAAALFGFERMVSLLKEWEMDPEIAESPLDMERFFRELKEAEEAVAAMGLG